MRNVLLPLTRKKYCYHSSAGRNGTIKEYISDGDYSITVDAGINNYTEGDDTGASMEYPVEKVTELQKLLSLPEALKVQSDFLEVLKSVLQWLRAFICHRRLTVTGSQFRS